MAGWEGKSRIGIDESGKGDYFGPLVVSAVLVSPEQANELADAGVKDSKRLTDGSIERLSKLITAICRHSVVRIGPSKYNELYSRIQNLNKLLAWGHSRALENVLEMCPECSIAISDQFGDESFLMNALMKKGRNVELIQMPRAEQDMAVAAASIMARAGFVRAMESLSNEAGFELPKGSSDPRVVEVASSIAAQGGEAALSRFAKMHFKCTKKALEGIASVEKGE